MKCYASDYCQKDKSSCSDVCGGYRVLRALYNLSRIPERYRYTIALKPENGEDLEAFTKLDNYKNDVLSMVDEGRGLYIWGKSTGNGKTSWACKIMSYFCGITKILCCKIPSDDIDRNSSRGSSTDGRQSNTYVRWENLYKRL